MDFAGSAGEPASSALKFTGEEKHAAIPIQSSKQIIGSILSSCAQHSNSFLSAREMARCNVIAAKRPRMKSIGR